MSVNLNKETQDIENSELVNILWTGGWDSTFRMIQLAIKGANVQPYYIIDTDRISSLKEIKQIHRIKEALLAKYKDCNIRDIKLIELGTIKVDEKFKNAYQRLLKDSFMGSQYVWIAALAEQVEGLELSIHKDDKAEYFARKLLSDSAKNDSDEQIIFGNLKFPILDYTKLEMEEEANLSNDLDILYKSWFCFRPINNTPCGICNPCIYSIQEGMGKRFTTRAKIYNKAPRIFNLARRVIGKVI